jgi:glycosyltransferase involved in cell wall biosynthesis
MPSERPTVSVVIAAYNAEATLAEQFAALERQVGDVDFEILLCDNGSTDGTVALAHAWADRLPMMRVIDASARRGPGAARNIGVTHARGEFLVFCDADDVIADDWIAQMLSSLREAPFVASRIEHRRLNPHFPEEFRAAEGMMYPTSRMPQYPMVGSGHMGVHKTAFEEIGGFDESMSTAEDLDLSWRLQLAGHRLIGNPNAVVHVRHRPTLRGVYRQAYGWGSLHRRIHHKYERVFAAHPPGPPHPGAELPSTPVWRDPQVDAPDETTDAPPAPPPAPSRPEGRARRILRRAGRIPRKLRRILRSPIELAPYARRIGLSVGRVMSRRDPNAPQLASDGRSWAPPKR